MRFAVHAPVLRAVIARAAAFIVCGSALWALLPVIARRELHMSPLRFGALLGCVGAGALFGAAVMPKLRALGPRSPDRRRQPALRRHHAGARPRAQRAAAVPRHARHRRRLDQHHVEPQRRRRLGRARMGPRARSASTCWSSRAASRSAASPGAASPASSARPEP
ncbi:MFS transporter [Nannocystis pusilla]|uniref:MFS transporter n=1 Tax=Nannocystis pusilla TaxID=889268 RepID=UPI003B7675B4